MNFVQSHPRIDHVLRLTSRRLGVIVVLWLVAVVLHNVLYGLLYRFFDPEWDEPVFFFVAGLAIPLYLLMATIYTLLFRIKKGQTSKEA